MNPTKGRVLGYNSSTGNDVTINTYAEATDPLFRLGYATNLYNNIHIPAWFVPITQVDYPWTGSQYSANDMSYTLHDMIYASSDYWKTYVFSDANYNVKGLNYKAQQSYFLRPVKSTTVSNF